MGEWSGWFVSPLVSQQRRAVDPIIHPRHPPPPSDPRPSNHCPHTRTHAPAVDRPKSLKNIAALSLSPSCLCVRVWFGGCGRQWACMMDASMLCRRLAARRSKRGASSCVIVGMNGRPTTHHQRPPAQANQPMHSHGSRAWLGRRRPACERLKRERRTGPLQATCKKQALALRRASPSARRAVIVSLPLRIYSSIFSFTSANFDTPHTAP